VRASTTRPAGAVLVVVGVAALCGLMAVGHTVSIDGAVGLEERERGDRGRRVLNRIHGSELTHGTDHDFHAWHGGACQCPPLLCPCSKIEHYFFALSSLHVARELLRVRSRHVSRMGFPFPAPIIGIMVLDKHHLRTCMAANYFFNTLVVLCAHAQKSTRRQISRRREVLAHLVHRFISQLCML